MTLDEIIQIIKSDEPMDLADSRLAFRIVFGKRPPIGFLCPELRNAIEDRLHRDHPEQFDELNHSDGMTDTEIIDWLQEQIVDVIYLDDGRLIDVKGNNVREAIQKAAKVAKVDEL